MVTTFIANDVFVVEINDVGGSSRLNGSQSSCQRPLTGGCSEGITGVP
jgi:hypothetical protein